VGLLVFLITYVVFLPEHRQKYYCLVPGFGYIEGRKEDNHFVITGCCGKVVLRMPKRLRINS
jgi:hypothetical protein